MKKITFPRIMIGTTWISGLVALGAALLYRLTEAGWLLSLAITFFTVFYHFAMRLTVGALIPNTVCPTSRWFQPRPFEAPLYKRLRVKKWKDRMPTYDPRLFSLQDNTLEGIVRNMCQAEVVHEVIALCSFIPLLFSLMWGTFGVFLTTSLLAAALDLSFVMLQRYNRPRILRLIKMQTATNHSHPQKEPQGVMKNEKSD